MTAERKPRLLDAALLTAMEVLATSWVKAEAEIEPFMTPAQLRLLKILAADEPMSVGIMAERMGALPSSITRMCNRLEAGGLLRRSTGTDDRRETILTLVPAGRQMLEQLSARRSEHICAVLERMPASAIANLREALAAYELASGGAPSPSLPRPSLRILRQGSER